MIVGYLRKINDDKIKLLKKAGCCHIFHADLDSIEHILKAGDTIIVWSIEDLDSVERFDSFDKKSIKIRSLKESIDFVQGAIYPVLQALLQLEKKGMRDKIKTGMAKTGKKIGRAKKLTDKKKQVAKKLWLDDGLPIEQICQSLDVCKKTLYNYIKE